jgi:hypothetical protein
MSGKTGCGSPRYRSIPRNAAANTSKLSRVDRIWSGSPPGGGLPARRLFSPGLVVPLDALNLAL